MNIKTFTSLLLCFCMCSPAIAKECDTLDVFEEYAEYDDIVCKTSSLSVSAEKNTVLSGEFDIECYEDYKIEITSPPEKGKLKVMKDNKTFEYTPYKNQVGTDSFSYKINSSGISSNISVCSITINDNSEKMLSDTDFSYADIEDNEVKNAAEKLISLDIIKGERVGGNYYFYPETPITRAAAICYLNAAANIEQASNDNKILSVFCDCNDLPEQLMKEANAAYTANIVTGKKTEEGLYLCPEEYITKAEFFCMLDRAMGSKTSSETEIKYIDRASIPDYAKICVKNLINANILTNSDTSALTPNNTLTKADIAVLLSRYISYNENNIVKTISQRIKEGFYGKIIT